MNERVFGKATRTPPVGGGVRLVRQPECVPLDGRRPRLLDDPTGALRIVRGHADVFAVPMLQDSPAGARHHLCRIETGGIILGLPSIVVGAPGPSIGAIAVGAQSAEVLVLDRDLIEDRNDIDGWIAALAAAVVESEAGWNVRAVERGAAMVLESGQQLRAPAHGVAWLAVESGEIALMGGASSCRSGDLPTPLASRMWGEARADTTVRILHTNEMSGSDMWRAVDQFHAFAMGRVAERLTTARDVEAERLRESIRRAAGQGGQLVTELAAVLAPTPDVHFRLGGADPLLDICRIVAEAIGEHIISPLNRDRSQQGLIDAAEIARWSRLRSRRVLLRGNWWQRDVGALVAWRGEERQPVALIPVTSRHYVVAEAGHAVGRRVDAKVAAELAPEAMMFYAQLPKLTGSVAGLLRFSLGHGAADVLRILFCALGMGVIGLATPLITEVLIDSVIPRTEWDQLTYCAVGLAMVAIGVAGFKIVQSVAILRLEGVLDRVLQSGIADRLLRLPVSFFRQYSAGDLTDRALGIEAIRRVAAGHSIQGLLAGVLALFSFALMFYFDFRLALIALALTGVRGAAIAVTSAIRLRRERRHFELDGKAQGLVLQLLTGVGKLRVACATQRALAVWAHKFAEQKRQFLASQRTANRLNVFESAFPTLALLLIFAGAGRRLDHVALDSGQFLAFFVAFGQSLEAVGQVATAIGATLIGVPRTDRLRPLLAEPTEIGEPRNPPGELTGAIELEQVTFRYTPGGPLILDKLAMQIDRGEYVALVGPSGSGKSTVLRLLLGFEKPEAGTIFFDGKAIDTLDIVAVRRQLGVILQNGKLTTGSLYENICGGAQLPLERAWEAARLAGFDGDIEAMPMGMHTMVAEGANTLSGGQCQRLMIARALVHRPRILLFDEATSALDNRTQAVVSGSLAKLNVTRIVIAQRLSTVKSADRIIVLAAGKIVQSGTFTELVNAPGIFAEFAKRQLL